MLMRISELGYWALIVFAFKSNSVRRQVGYLTISFDSHASAFITSVGIINAVRQFYLSGQR